MKPALARTLPAIGRRTGAQLRRLMKGACALHEREHLRVRAEIQRIPGLMNLLMKARNGRPWSAEERALLQSQLRGLGTVGLYLAIIIVPGSTLTLPLLAWWLDRRRWRRAAALNANNSSTASAPSRQ